MGRSEISYFCTLHKGKFLHLCHSPETPDFIASTAPVSASPVLHMPLLMPSISHNNIGNRECAGF